MIEIEKATLDDLNDLAKLYQELSGLETNLAKLRENFIWMQSNPDYIVLRAKYNYEIAGSLMGIICRDLVGECKPFMVIENVIVASRYHHRGIGRRLMEEIERLAKERGCYYTMFVSAGQKTEAHKFYESLGYPIDAVKGFKKYL